MITRHAVFEDAIHRYIEEYHRFNCRRVGYSCCRIIAGVGGDDAGDIRQLWRARYSRAIVAAARRIDPDADDMRPFAEIIDDLAHPSSDVPFKLRITCLKLFRDGHPERVGAAVMRAHKKLLSERMQTQPKETGNGQ